MAVKMKLNDDEAAFERLYKEACDIQTLLNKFRYWKNKAMSRVEVVTCENCIWCDEEYYQQTGKYACKTHTGFITDDRNFFCKSGMKKKDLETEEE